MNGTKSTLTAYSTQAQPLAQAKAYPDRGVLGCAYPSLDLPGT